MQETTISARMERLSRYLLVLILFQLEKPRLLGVDCFAYGKNRDCTYDEFCCMHKSLNLRSRVLLYIIKAIGSFNQLIYL